MGKGYFSTVILTTEDINTKDVGNAFPSGDMISRKSVSPFRLCSLLRQQKDPELALKLFQNPNPHSSSKSFRHSLLAYDLIITKLARAKMFSDMVRVLHALKHDTTFSPSESLLCHVIRAYGRARMPGPATRLFESLPSFRCRRTVKSFNTLLSALLYCREYELMVELFDNVHEYAYPDACTYNILINANGVLGCLDGAMEVFDKMHKRAILPNAATFGTLVHLLCANGKLDEALKLKREMLDIYAIHPNIYVYTPLIKALCRTSNVKMAFELKDEMEKGEIALDSTIYNTLIHALYENGRKDEVSQLLKEMHDKGCKPNTVTYNIMINQYCKDKDCAAAHRILDEMEEKGSKPDVVSYNVIIRGLCKDGKLSEANDLFEDMPRRGCAPDIVSYRILFDALCDSMKFKEAALILDEMVFKGFAPRSERIDQLLERLLECNVDLFETVVSSLAKGFVIDAGNWMRIVSLICKEDNLQSSELERMQS